jgi:hypothetical protein
VIRSITKDLRELAHKCTALARNYQTSSLSNVLEELATDLMAKALELERKFDQ